MSRHDTRLFDPLSFIPSPEVVQKHLAETEQLAERLRVLLRVSQQVHTPRPADQLAEKVEVES
jgi:hypothetical protein